MGWDCPKRQTTADFLTSLTNPAERVPRPGYEDKLPYTPVEFEEYWKKSPQYKKLIEDIEEYLKQKEGSDRDLYHQAHVARQSNHISQKSSFTVSFFMQTRYIMSRNILRTKGDPSIALQSIALQVVMGLIIGSTYYNLETTTGSLFYREAVLFFAILFNSFSSILEIMSLFEARPIVEKHKQYALYRPSADALAGIITELPTKFFMSMGFNFFVYFLSNMRRDAGRFFFYWLMNALCTLVMSHFFRSLGAVSTSFPGAMTPATVVLLAMVIFSGYCIPPPNMLGWSRWIGYINPVSYVFEALMINEFNDREFTCSAFVPAGPSYMDISSDQSICSVTGSRPGLSFVNGSDHIAVTYEYYNSHKWGCFGIIVGFIVFFLVLYVILSEFNKGSMQKGEVTLFLKSSLKEHKKQAAKGAATTKDIENSNISNEKISHKDQLDANKEENNNNNNALPSSKDIFHWRDLTYQVKIKSEDRVILNHVDGWVKPGQLTALMGSSGAGKTTLLNCLSERVTSGIISDGTRMINGQELGSSFQRSIGYVQQQDLHLPTSTVREALRFSAQLRQPNSVSIQEKNEYVEYIIHLLDMNLYADALVGVAGEGLNVEQRKRLTIGVELVAKPKLLIFLDEPTSGLDSQTAWSICKLMRKLADHGQAILCTIHQPSAILLQEFDRLLFLQKGGKTVYFGDLGENCHTLIDYFEKYGAHHCPEEANPSEWMLEVVGAAPGSHANQDYHEVWKNSAEYQMVKDHLTEMETELVKIPRDESQEAKRSFAAPIWKQYLIVTKRIFEQNWRSPSYIYSKLILVISSSLFNGFAFFKADRSLQGLQNQMISIIQFLVPFMTLVQQMMPYYIKQRDIYEVREAPSKTFSWFAFITAQITSEIPYQVVIGTLGFFCWYYPVGLYDNAVPTDSVDSRGVLMWLYITAFYVYTSTMGQLCISFIEVPENAANLAVNLFTVCLIFCGVLAPYDFLPGFWTFMYRCSPMTYFVQGMGSTGLSNVEAVCSESELLRFEPRSGQTCGSYMADYIKQTGGYLVDGNATSKCEYCTTKSTNDYLASVDSLFSERWRNWGIVICFIAFNIIFTVFFYWIARVPKSNRQKK
ncbi:DEHA2F00154p [Debaryomyces hansenii CBS767]|uniref:DEHA2F00154p n=1 Tax=Debaryomyces hansenii (strain ATCC 36239 / CBS 767 / BCRC 21394 / JCM 1990 / NBRC 0083 / IGC 2968) TaxID=284592 RepID=Q6BN52_DEBHA|nr:DEHA2F00154p [Debaryomyces hansenii CBS767]CAG88660.2 DEHA2F00154p [Debaryomyces hansenii CBS767]|eukprot:XP_460368.2 DEHA2F00154p [Debaryomyces hansenii CBS767]